MKVLKALKALSDETRLRLFAVISQHELNVNEIVRLMQMGQSRISRHLKILVDADILQSRRDGLWVFYRIADVPEMDALLKSVFDRACEEAGIKADLKRAADIVHERTRRQKKFFNDLAADWEHLKRDLLGDFDLNASIIEYLGGSGSVADVGCGTGDLLDAIGARAEPVIGIDNSRNMLQVAEARLNDRPGADLRLGEAEHLPLRDEEVESLVMNMVLHHLQNPAVALREAYRVLKPYGRIVITDFIRHADESLRERYGDRWLGFGTAELVGMLKASGFTGIEKYFHTIQDNLRIQLIVSEKTEE